MRKGKSVIGKDVLSLADGVKLQTVSDLVVDAGARRVVALVVEEGGFMSSSIVVPTQEVESYGRDAVVVRSAESVMSVGDHADLRALVERHEKIIGKKVFTTTGDDQGSISDLYFDERSGDVLGFEVSSGLLGDAAKGTSYLANDEITGVGPELMYVRPETADVLEGQVGGLQGVMADAGSKLGQTKDAASRKLDEGKPEDKLIGQRTGSDVEADDGSVIVPKGRRIREEDVAAAREAGKLPALSSSVAMATAQKAGAEAKDALGTVGDSAASLWDKFTAKVGEMTDATGKRVDQEQTKRRLSEITDAIGRPVKKVILDREDNVVLNLGDIITHQAVQRAHDSGGLDSLLGSVYKADVEFSKEEMRAPKEAPAQATVEKATGGAAVVDQLESEVEVAETEREAENERKRIQSEAEREQREREREQRGAERDEAKAAREAEEREALANSSAATTQASSTAVKARPTKS